MLCGDRVVDFVILIWYEISPRSSITKPVQRGKKANHAVSTCSYLWITSMSNLLTPLTPQFSNTGSSNLPRSKNCFLAPKSKYDHHAGVTSGHDMQTIFTNQSVTGFQFTVNAHSNSVYIGVDKKTCEEFNCDISETMHYFLWRKCIKGV
jgi:hypothetical protein